MQTSPIACIFLLVAQHGTLRHAAGEALLSQNAPP